MAQTTLPDETIDAIYSKFSELKTDNNGNTIRIMTNDGFTSFLMSSDNMAFSEKQLRVCDDMTRPLCEYYISSSHNVSRYGEMVAEVVALCFLEADFGNDRRHILSVVNSLVTALQKATFVLYSKGVVQSNVS